MARVYNFSAGPAAMPVSVLQEAQREFLDYAGSGMSVLEMSHRSAAYQEVIDAAENNLRSLVGIPDSYGVLAGRRHAPVRRHPHEPHGHRACRLHCVGAFCRERLA